jgi:hypothetical protein
VVPRIVPANGQGISNTEQSRNVYDFHARAICRNVFAIDLYIPSLEPFDALYVYVRFAVKHED